jgi:hypothetical protein
MGRQQCKNISVAKSTAAAHLYSDLAVAPVASSALRLIVSMTAENDEYYNVLHINLTGGLKS